jgi:hypothetical protein
MQNNILGVGSDADNYTDGSYNIKAKINTTI